MTDKKSPNTKGRGNLESFNINFTDTAVTIKASSATADPVESFKQAIRNVLGIEPPDHIIQSGKIVRFSTNGRRDDDSGWYVFHSGNLPHAIFGDWRQGDGNHFWCVKDEHSMSIIERTMLNSLRDKARADFEAETKAGHMKAAEKANEVMAVAQPANGDHPYLIGKQVSPTPFLREMPADELSTLIGYQPKSGGVSLSGRILIAPISSDEGANSSLEFIDEDGRKSALAGGRKSGCFWLPQPLERDLPVVMVAEGIATALSAHEATGYPVIASLSGANLVKVSEMLRARYPVAQIVILADLGKDREPYPKALEAARAVNGTLVIPSCAGTDFNDMRVEKGLEAVYQIISDAVGEAVEVDPNVAPPKPVDAMFYGLVGRVAMAASSGTEANKVAAGAALLSYLSANIGRDLYMMVGNTAHHARLFTAHVGRSGRGRKGDAISLTDRIRTEIQTKWAGTGCQVHAGGLSTREGMVMFIHDGYSLGKTEVAPIDDKRLWVVESEFANVLQQQKRDGNTLSAGLRDAWDGVSIKPAVKNSPLWTTDPHIALHVCVTPKELRELMSSRDLSNGFANRFLFILGEREKYVPIPRATPYEQVSQFAAELAGIISWAMGRYPETKNSRLMALSPDAEKAWLTIYRRMVSDESTELLTSLMERSAPYVLRLAMIFAITDRSLMVEVRHLEAAVAWVDYSRESIRFIFGNAEDMIRNSESKANAERIVAFLSEREGGANRSEIYSKCFRSHLSAGKIDEAIGFLLSESQQRITVTEVPRKGGTKGNSTKIYRVMSVLSVMSDGPGPVAMRNECVMRSDSDSPKKHNTQITQILRNPETRATREITQNTQITHTYSGKTSTALMDSEVF